MIKKKKEIGYTKPRTLPINKKICLFIFCLNFKKEFGFLKNGGSNAIFDVDRQLHDSTPNEFQQFSKKNKII
jgi:hypothetical protein